MMMMSKAVSGIGFPRIGPRFCPLSPPGSSGAAAPPAPPDQPPLDRDHDDKWNSDFAQDREAGGRNRARRDQLPGERRHGGERGEAEQGQRNPVDRRDAAGHREPDAE